MSGLRDTLAALAAILALATTQMYSPAANAGGEGGAGITFSGTYSDEDEDDDEDATDTPTTFAPIDWRPRSSSFGSFTLVRPIELADPQEEVGARIIAEAYFGYKDKGLSLSPRITYRFPSYDQTELPKPKYALWLDDETVDNLDAETTVAEGLIAHLETITQEEAIAGFFGGTIEQAREFIVWMEEGGSKEQASQHSARKWLGSEAYDKIRSEFGPASAGTAAGDTSALDASEWNETYLYCGGTCVAAGY